MVNKRYNVLMNSITQVNNLLEGYKFNQSHGMNKHYFKEDVDNIINFHEEMRFYIKNKNRFTKSQQKNIETKIAQFDIKSYFHMLNKGITIYSWYKPCLC